MLPSSLAAMLVMALVVTLAGLDFPLAETLRVALSFPSPGYELFAEADAQGPTVSTERQRCKINTPRKSS